MRSDFALLTTVHRKYQLVTRSPGVHQKYARSPGDVVKMEQLPKLSVQKTDLQWVGQQLILIFRNGILIPRLPRKLCNGQPGRWIWPSQPATIPSQSPFLFRLFFTVRHGYSAAVVAAGHPPINCAIAAF